LTFRAESSVYLPCFPLSFRCWSGLGRAREVGGIVSEAGVPESVTIPALPEQVRVVRAFVAGVLGRSHTEADVALLLASELVTNSVRHGGSAVPGGLVTVTVAVCGEVVRIEVTERSGDGVPVLKPGDGGGEAEGSRGLLLVDALAARWGYQRGGGLATTWFEVRKG
jgi:anti-sigma regulatory factor (Ser/Thr protein kinase)